MFICLLTKTNWQSCTSKERVSKSQLSTTIKQLPRHLSLQKIHINFNIIKTNFRWASTWGKNVDRISYDHHCPQKGILKLTKGPFKFYHDRCYSCWKNGPTQPLFLYFRLFNTQLTANKCSIWINFCQWLDSNRRPLVSEVTALPTEPQPLPRCYSCLVVDNGRLNVPTF